MYILVLLSITLYPIPYTPTPYVGHWWDPQPHTLSGMLMRSRDVCATTPGAGMTARSGSVSRDRTPRALRPTRWPAAHTRMRYIRYSAKPPGKCECDWDWDGMCVIVMEWVWLCVNDSWKISVNFNVVWWMLARYCVEYIYLTNYPMCLRPISPTHSNPVCLTIVAISVWRLLERRPVPSRLTPT